MKSERWPGRQGAPASRTRSAATGEHRTGEDAGAAAPLRPGLRELCVDQRTCPMGPQAPQAPGAARRCFPTPTRTRATPNGDAIYRRYAAHEPVLLATGVRRAPDGGDPRSSPRSTHRPRHANTAGTCTSEERRRSVSPCGSKAHGSCCTWLATSTASASHGSACSTGHQEWAYTTRAAVGTASWLPTTSSRRRTASWQAGAHHSKDRC